jgi:hypothetical protein
MTAILAGAVSEMALWTPADITTALWLDAADSSTLFDAVSGGSLVAADGAVARWEDKSGNARHATQSTSGERPQRKTSIVNGRDVLRLDGGDSMSVPHSSDLNLQIGTSTAISCYRKAAGFRIMQKKNGAGALQADSWFFDDGTVFSVAGTFTIDYATNQNANQFDVGVWNGTTLSHFRNGTKLTPTTANSGTIVGGEIDPTLTPAANTDALFIGRRQNPSGTTGIMTGDLLEIVLVGTSLSTSDRQKAEGYLAHKWGLTANLPSDHPYKNIPPGFVPTRRRRSRSGGGVL